MKKWQPVIASVIVIAVAFGGMAIWRFSGGTKAHGGNNTSANVPANAPTDGGLKYEWAKLEKLPALDPLGLYPRDGERLAAPEFWMIWDTGTHSECRLLATKDRRDWYDLGRTAGEKHFLSANLGYFDSRLSFSVEWASDGTHYRSAPREVSFGKGAAFGQRHYKFTLSDEKTQTWDLEITGSNVHDLGQEAFVFLMSPEGLTPITYLTDKTDSVVFGIDNAQVIEKGCALFLQVHDWRNETYDRVLIELAR